MTTPVPHPALAPFTPEVREWFTRAFAEPTPAQVQAWPAISAGAHALVSAPTGSGKTLAAFLWALDRFVAEPPPPDPRERKLRLVYISPLKALGYDVERNLRAPLRGIGADVRVGVRTGDTPQRERRGDAAPPARRPHHHAGIPLPDAHVAGANAVRRHGMGHRRRDPRGGADQARRPPRRDPGAAGRAGGPRRAADRPVGDAAAPRRGGALSRRPRPRLHRRRRRRAQAARPAHPRAGRVDGRARLDPGARLHPRAARRPGAASGRPSTRSCCSWSASTARRSSS